MLAGQETADGRTRRAVERSIVVTQVPLPALHYNGLWLQFSVHILCGCH